MNSEGKIINVNSWIECANYVNGGWFSDKIDLINGEKLVLYTTIILLIIHFISSKFSLKRAEISNKLTKNIIIFIFFLVLPWLNTFNSSETNLVELNEKCGFLSIKYLYI